LFIYLDIFLYRNPKYFPNPEKFDPERFNDDNKHKIQDFTYLPFGAGPR
jgi:cytochrome P450